MTWAGEPAIEESGLFLLTQDGTPLEIPLGDNNDVLSVKGGNIVFAPASGTVGNHNLLSATHTDTAPSGATDGNLIYASGDLWRGLPVGSGDTLLTSIDGYPQWTNPTGITVLNNTIDVVNTIVASGATANIFAVDSITSSSTTSTSYVQIPDMEIIGPPSGLYVALFNSEASCSSSNKQVSIAIFAGEVIIESSVRDITVSSANTLQLATTAGASVPVSGNDTVSVRWKKSGAGTWTVQGRTLAIFKAINNV